MRKALKTLSTVVFVLVCLIGVGFLLMSKQQNEALVLAGECADWIWHRWRTCVHRPQATRGWCRAEVRVTVTDHRIANIELLKHVTGLGKPAEATLPAMVAENNYEVDAVTGATASSLTLRNAVNDALRQGLAP